MSDKRFSKSIKLALLAIPVAAALILVSLFGGQTFSKDNRGEFTLTEYREQGLSSETKTRSSTLKAGAEPAGQATGFEVSEDLSKAGLAVQRLSCSSCIQEIKAALSGIQGIEETLVDVSSGTVQVYYNSKTLTNPDRLAQAITSRGYPATLIKIYSSEELRKEQAVAAAKSQYYIASVGGWDIAQSDLETQLEHAKKRYSKLYGEGVFLSERGKSLLDGLRVQIASRLIDEGVMMQEIIKAGYTVNSALVEKELEKIVRESGKEPDDFKKELNEEGMSFEYFKKKLETEILISRYLEERILTGVSTDTERRNLLTSWFNNAKLLADVTYYDKDLERLVQQRGAKGGCCG